MSEQITIFYASKSSTKVPISQYNDKTFVFETYQTNSNLDFFTILVKHFVLNIPLNISKPIRTFRRKTNLTQHQSDNLRYLILDIDDVHTEKSKQKILEYFKDYKVILGKSRSYNGIDNFRMKGVLFCEEISLKDAKLALSDIHHDLKTDCIIDESVARHVSYNAPILKNDIFINNENGELYKFNRKEAQQHIYESTNEQTKFTDSEIEKFKDLEADTIEKLCLKVFQNMGFSAIRNNPNGSISFKHPDELKSPGGYFWFSSSPYTMHHGNSTRTINIFDAVRKLPSAKELMQQNINYDSAFLEFNTDTNVISVNKKYLKVTSEIQDTITEFLEQPLGLFSIRSPMGTGKSTVINHIIEEAHEEDLRVLIITNRISVAQDFGKKYKIKVYNSDKYEIGDSLICQFDSLWKYNINFFDIVIMDEFISLMLHSRSNLNNSSMNISKFFAAFNKKLVIADAFLTGYENFLLKNKESNLHLLDNIYRDPTTLFSYDNFNYFVDSLIYHANKHKITVSSTSLGFINSLRMLLSKRGLKVVTLTAETPDSTKELIYGLFEKDDHDKWDVLIFSPTLTVGVSNLNNINYHFHFDSSMSSDVISSIQMIKRTRKTKEIHMHIKDRINYIKTTYEDIRDEYMCNIGKNVEQNYLFDIDDYGEPRLSEIGKKAIKIDTFKNILEFNHKKAFLWLMKYHFIKEPRIIEKTFSGNVLTKYLKEIKSDNDKILRLNIEEFLLLNDIEKTSLLIDSDSNNTMRALAEIDSEIKDCPIDVKEKILECALKDRTFIQKCRFYRATFNYTKKIWDDSDIKSLVSKSILSGRKDDLHFYNVLIDYGQIEIFEEYLPKHINKNKKLKFLLDNCGYRITKNSDVGVVGHRGYRLDKLIKEFYGWIK